MPRGKLNYNAGWFFGNWKPIGCNLTSHSDRCPGYDGPVSADNRRHLVSVYLLCPDLSDPAKVAAENKILTDIGFDNLTGTPYESKCTHDCNGRHGLAVGIMETDGKVWNNGYRKVKFRIDARKEFGSKDDLWTINHNKRLKNVRSPL